MVRLAVVQHSRDGYSLSVREMPLWALVADRAVESVLMPATFHLLCCRTPGWTYKAGFGRLDEDGWRPHNLGWGIACLTNWMAAVGYRHEREAWSRPLSFDEVCEHFPSARVGWDDDGADFVRGVMIDHVQEEHGEFGVVS